jgi:hypothetical protein
MEIVSVGMNGCNLQSNESTEESPKRDHSAGPVFDLSNGRRWQIEKALIKDGSATCVPTKMNTFLPSIHPTVLFHAPMHSLLLDIHPLR